MTARAFHGNVTIMYSKEKTGKKNQYITRSQLRGRSIK